MSSENAATAPLSIQSFTSSEAGAWSNSYLISGRSEAVLFDVFQLHSEAVQLAEMIAQSGKTLKTVMISHAHPDHFMGLDAITERFPQAHVVSTPNVIADIRENGPWMFSLLQSKLGPEGPTRLVVPEALAEPALYI
jgi:glyoxylase-like metal-dependent hydrolase (beta-lactamase superfamily II)